MKTIEKFGLAIVLILVTPITVSAECRRSYVCDDYGSNCQYMDVCDDALDLPSVDINPLPSLPTIDLKPLPSLELPPLGTSQCEYKQVDGQWQNVCW